MREKVVQGLGVRARHHLCHPLHIALGRLQQTAQVGSRLESHRMSPEAKKRRKFLLERQESRRQLLEGSWDTASLLSITVL